MGFVPSGLSHRAVVQAHALRRRHTPSPGPGATAPLLLPFTAHFCVCFTFLFCFVLSGFCSSSLPSLGDTHLSKTLGHVSPYLLESSWEGRMDPIWGVDKGTRELPFSKPFPVYYALVPHGLYPGAAASHAMQRQRG
jgi:hypothetical protein